MKLKEISGEGGIYMLLFDTLVAEIIFGMFGETGLRLLFMICCVTILRTATNVNGFLKEIKENIVIEKEEEED